SGFRNVCRKILQTCSAYQKPRVNLIRSDNQQTSSMTYRCSSNSGHRHDAVVSKIFTGNVLLRPAAILFPLFTGSRRECEKRVVRNLTVRNPGGSCRGVGCLK